MKAVPSRTPPIACTLSAGDYRDRIASIADLNRDALRGHHRDDLRLELAYEPAARQRVREMVRREQECCAFLSFELHEDDDGVRVAIIAPDDAREAASALFEEFTTRTSSRTPCACGAAGQRPQPDGIALPHVEIAADRAIDRNDHAGRRVGVAAMAIATGALACGVVCLLRVLLPAVALTAAGSLLGWFAGVHAWFTGAALLAVGAGWLWVWRRRTRTKCRPARSTLFTMAIATAILGLALAWPSVEPHVLRMMGGR